MATLTELQTFAQRHGWHDQTTAGTAQLTAWINDTLRFLAIERRWNFYETAGYFNLAEPYKTGTVGITKAGTTVTGAGTTFAAGMAGQEFYTSEDAGRVYQVAGITDTTHLELESGYVGDTISGKTYEIRYIRYAAPSDWGQEGVFLLEDGRELNYDEMGLADFHRLRMQERSTVSYPTRLMRHNLAGTDYFFVHPAPSAVKAVRYTYYRLPAELAAGASVADMPNGFRALLHEALRIRLSVDENNQALETMREDRYQRMVDRLFHVQQPGRPTPILTGEGRAGAKIGLGGLASIFNIEA